MSELPDTVCLHCEQRPPTHYLGLCAGCAEVRGIRLLYTKRRGWTPAWDAHLRRLAQRARQRLPLFPRPGSADGPADARPS